MPDSSGELAGRERRQADRRLEGRRRDSRRPPTPLWRRPAALVAYGVLAAAAVFMVMQPGSEDEIVEDESRLETDDLSATPKRDPVTGSYEATREAFSLAQYEELIAEGQDAVGEVVRTELYCGSISLVTASEKEGPVSPLAPLKDAQGKVPAAECRWSQEARTSDFLLLVPPDLAESFARAPEVELDFVSRRVIPADVEWLGRSEALALRTAGVLRNIR